MDSLFYNDVQAKQSQAVILTGTGSPQKNMVPPVLVCLGKNMFEPSPATPGEIALGGLALTRFSDVYMKLEAWLA